MVSSAPAKGAQDFLHTPGLPHQDRSLHQAAHLSRPKRPAEPSAKIGPREAGPSGARDPATRDAPHPRPHLLRHRAGGLVGGSETEPALYPALRRRRLSLVLLVKELPLGLGG